MFAHSLVERTGDFHMHETGLAQTFGATRMNRHGRAVQEPFSGRPAQDGGVSSVATESELVM